MKQLDNPYFKAQEELPIEPEVERFFNLPKGAIYTRTKMREISLPRKIAQYLEYNENYKNFKTPRLKKIAAKYPGQKNEHIDHSTILQNIRSIKNIMSVDKKFRQLIYDCQISIWGEIKYKD